MTRKADAAYTMRVDYEGSQHLAHTRYYKTEKKALDVLEGRMRFHRRMIKTTGKGSGTTLTLTRLSDGAVFDYDRWRWAVPDAAPRS